MIIFYDDDPICVTGQWFINGHRRYPINQLRNPRTTYKSPGLPVRRFLIFTVPPLLVPAAMGPALPTAVTVAISVAIILVTLVTGMVRHRRVKRLGPTDASAECGPESCCTRASVGPTIVRERRRCSSMSP